MLKRILSLMLVASMTITILSKTALADHEEAIGEPTLTALTLRNSDGELVSLLNNSEAVTVSLGTTYTFEAVFSNAEQISKVYITSTKGNEKRLLKTSYDEEAGAFVSNGFFGGDSSYIPGKIGVEYTRKINDLKVGDGVDWGTLQATLEDYCTATVSSASGETIQATVDISKLLNAEKDTAINVVVDVFDAATDGDLNEWLGYYHDLESMQKRILEEGKYYLYLDDTDPETYIAMVVRDVSGSRYTKLILNEAGEYVDSLVKVAEDLSNVNLISGILYDYLDIKASTDSLREEIAADPTISSSQKSQLNAEVDDYENDRWSFALLTSVLPVVVAAAGGTMVGPTIVFNALLSAIGATAGTFWDYRIGMLRGCEPVDVNFVGGAHGIPLTYEYLRENRNRITDSGTYYLTGAFYEDGWGSTIKIGDSDSDTPVNVTLCLHGHSDSVILASSSSTLKICDCTYREHEDGTVTGGRINISGYESDQTIIMESGTASQIKLFGGENRGNIIMNGGVVDYISINNRNGNGKVVVNNGTITLGISVYGDESEIIINDGVILAPVSSGQFSRAHVRTDGGSIKVYGGQIYTSIEAGTGTLDIYDGIIDTFLKNEGAMINISGGMIKWPIRNLEGLLTIYGGIIAGVNNGTNGTVNIIDGTIIAPDRNGILSDPIANSGTLIISGGIMQGSERGVSVQNSGDAIIKSGLFQGCIINWKNGIMTLLVSENSNIEVTSTSTRFPDSFSERDSGAVVVSAAINYTGDVAYYRATNDVGIKISMEEAANIDFTTLPYVRLSGDCAFGGSNSSGTAAYTVSFDAHGGSGMMADVTVAFDDYVLPACRFEAPDGERFKAWSIDGVEYAPGDTYTFTGDATIIAVWQDVGEKTPLAVACQSVISTITGSTVSLKTSAEESVTLTCVVAAYDRSDRLVTSKMATWPVAAINGPVRLTVEYQAGDQVCCIKTFVLDSASNAPLRSVWIKRWK